MTVNADAAFSPEWRVGAVWLLEQFDSGATWFHVADLKTVMGCYPVWPNTSPPNNHNVTRNLIRFLRKKNAVGRRRDFPGYPVKDVQTGCVNAAWLASKVLADVWSFDGCPDREFDGRRDIKSGIRDVVATYCSIGKQNPPDPWSVGLKKVRWQELNPTLTDKEFENIRIKNPERVEDAGGRGRGPWKFRKSLCHDYALNCPEFSEPTI